MIKCPKCGKELPDGTAFCLDCFTSLIEKPAEAQPLKKTGRVALFFKSKNFRIVCSAVAALAVTVTGAVLMKRYIKPTVTVAADDTTLVEVTDENGEAVTDESGEAVMAVIVEVTDKNGEAVTNSDGSKKLQTVVPVTNRSGEAVTSKDGQQVFEVVTQSPSPTESTTKKGLFSKFFGDDNQGDNNTTTAAQSSTATEKPEETTAKPTTQPATQPTTQPATQPTNNQPTSSGFEYDIYNGYVRILKYTGSDKNVVVPAEIDGTRVGYLGTNVFPSDTKSITFNSDNYSFGYSAFAQCLDLEAIYFAGTATYKSVDGVVFVGNTLSYYPIGKKDSNYTTPEFCTTIGQNSVRNNPYIKTFTISSDNMQYEHNVIYNNFIGCTSLTAINLTKETNTLKSVDGVLFYLQSPSTDIGDVYFVYPYGKQDSYFEFPSFGTIHVMADSFCGNPYLKTIKFKSNIGSFSVLSVHNSNNRPKNLEKIYLPDNEKQHAFLEDGYNSWCFNTHNITVEFY